ncbi:hypothetical protein Peur_050700 [Populus x canadensis]
MKARTPCAEESQERNILSLEKTKNSSFWKLCSRTISVHCLQVISPMCHRSKVNPPASIGVANHVSKMVNPNRIDYGRMHAPYSINSSIEYSLLCFPCSLPIGVCYGLNGNNLPPPSEVVGLYKRSGIEFIRLYEPRSDVLEALRGSGLAVALCPANEDLANIAQRPDAADAWVNTNIAPYMSDVLFRWIILGNEVIPGPLANYVPAAIANTRNSLAAIGLANVTVTTAIPGNALEASYPPSAGAFSSDVTDVMIAVAGILASSGAPLMINVYPYFSYASNPSQVSVDYALFAATTPVVTDGSFLYYDLFDAMVDAFHAALEKIGYPGLRVAIGESGWPSAGNDPFTSIDNAMIYNRNLVNHVLTNGTPRRPGEIMETFLFAMFNENLKQGAVEQNFGFFYPNMNPVYPFW